MYRVVMYGLLALSTIAIILGFLNQLPFSGLELLVSAVFLVFTGYGLNLTLAKLFKALPNAESSVITALILFLTISPGVTLPSLISLFLAVLIANASKYVLAINRKHIFNPAGLTLLILSVTGWGTVSWWVSEPILLPFVAVLGFLVVRKIRRFSLFFSFWIASNLVQLLRTSTLLTPGDYSRNLFFATIMLVEPLTSPATRNLQIIFGALVGGLYSLPFSLGPIYSSAELSLILGNIFNLLVSPKQRLTLTLKERVNLSADIYQFSFKSNPKLNFKPGQYLEWTLPLKKTDGRGNRRFFTIASSPTEADLKLGIKIPDKSSSFKQDLLDLKVGDIISASHLGGEFTLPKDKNQKLLFIAGGIGVTPFRSMVKYLIDTKQSRDIVLFYCCKTKDEFVYQDIFKTAESLGVKTVYVETDKDGFLDQKMIEKYASDYKERKFYISGPPMMVKSYQKLSTNSVTDLFIGY